MTRPEAMNADAVDAALAAVTRRAEQARDSAERRWLAARSGPAGLGSATLDECAEQFAQAGALTINFHPDRRARTGSTVARGLLHQGRYHSQWITGISNGSRSAIADGERHRFEHHLFAAAYEGVDPLNEDLPVYGAFDLWGDPFGGSPRFGSSHLVLHPSVLSRTTLCVGDSHAAPTDVGTVDNPWSLLAGLAEQPWCGASLEALLSGRLPAAGPSRRLDGYIEAQVHGGVDLARDVTKAVIDPSFVGTDVADDLRSAADLYGFTLEIHAGSELDAADVPEDFRGPTMPALARRIARPDGIVDARAIGQAANSINWQPPQPLGDPPDSDAQQLKYLWHTLLAFGHDA
jgi:hypothetical protein